MPNSKQRWSNSSSVNSFSSAAKRSSRATDTVGIFPAAPVPAGSPGRRACRGVHGETVRRIGRFPSSTSRCNDWCFQHAARAAARRSSRERAPGPGAFVRCRPTRGCQPAATDPRPRPQVEALLDQCGADMDKAGEGARTRAQLAPTCLLGGVRRRGAGKPLPAPRTPRRDDSALCGGALGRPRNDCAAPVAGSGPEREESRCSAATLSALETRSHARGRHQVDAPTRCCVPGARQGRHGAAGRRGRPVCGGRGGSAPSGLCLRGRGRVALLCRCAGRTRHPLCARRSRGEAAGEQCKGTSGCGRLSWWPAGSCARLQSRLREVERRRGQRGRCDTCPGQGLPTFAWRRARSAARRLPAPWCHARSCSPARAARRDSPALRAA